MKLSTAFITKLKDAVDIVDLVSRYTQLIPSGKYYLAKCPRPKEHESGEDKAPSFRVVPESQSWYCGACHSGPKDPKCQHGPNYGSDCIAFMQWYHGCTWFQACKMLAEMYSVPLESDKNAPLYERQRNRSYSYHLNLTDKMKKYLHDRGTSDDSIKDFMIGFNGSQLTIPLINRQGDHVGFTKRSFDPNEPKYKNSNNSEIFHKSSYFYGIHLVGRDSDELRISEGAFDVIIPHQYGVKNIVSTLGTSFTSYHIEVIRNLGKVPVLCMDGDKAGRRSIQKAAELLSNHGIYCKVLLLPDNMDMADLANEYKEETEAYIQQNSMSYGSFLLQDSLKLYESQMDIVNQRMIPMFKEALQQVKNKDEQRVMIDRIYRNTGLRL